MEKIKGYRELNTEELELINEIKDAGEKLQSLIEKCGQSSAPTHPESGRWRAIAKTHLQQGLMALTRSVAKPEGF